MAARLIDDVFDALDEQTDVVPDTATLDLVIPTPAASLATVHTQRRALEAQINTVLQARPLSPVLASMPGVGVRTATVLLVTVGDGTSFPTAAHLASYAGLAPTTKSSGTSIHGEHAPRGGNRQLKRAMFLSAFACMNADPDSRTYYDRQRARGKSHPQDLLRLARHRISVLFAMLRNGTFYEPRAPRTSNSPHDPGKPNHPEPNPGTLTKGIEAPPSFRFARAGRPPSPHLVGPASRICPSARGLAVDVRELIDSPVLVSTSRPGL